MNKHAQGWKENNTFSLYQIKKQGLLLGKRGKPLKTHNQIKKVVKSLGYEGPPYNIRKDDIDRYNAAIRLVKF